MTIDANRLKFFTLFLCKIFTTKKCVWKIITFLNGISRYAFLLDLVSVGDDVDG